MATETTSTAPVGLAAGAVLVLLTSAATVVGAPTWLRTVLFVLAALAVAERVVRLRRRGPADAVLVGTGGVLVVLALLGLLLNYLPWGITAASWAVGFAVVGMVALAACVGRDAPAPTLPRISPLTAVTGGLAVAVLATAVVVSVYSYEGNRTVPLEFSAEGPPTGGVATVTLTSAEATGPLRLVSVSRAGTSVIDPDVELVAGQTVTRAVEVPAGFRLQVQVQRPGSTDPLRELILDGGGLLPRSGS